LTVNPTVQPAVESTVGPTTDYKVNRDEVSLRPFFRDHPGEPVPEDNFGLSGARED